MKTKFRFLIYILLFETFSVPLRAQSSGSEKSGWGSAWESIKDVGSKVLPYAAGYAVDRYTGQNRNPANAQGNLSASPLDKLGCNLGTLPGLQIPACPAGDNATSIDSRTEQQVLFARTQLGNYQSQLYQCDGNKDKALVTLFDNNIRDIDLEWTNVEKEHAKFSSDVLVPFREDLVKDYNALYTGKGIKFSEIYRDSSCRSIAGVDDFDAMGSQGKGGLRELINQNKETLEHQENFSKDPALPTRLNTFINHVSTLAGNGGLGKLDTLNSKVSGADSFSSSATYTSTLQGLKDKYNSKFTNYQDELKKYVGGTPYSGIIKKLSKKNIDTVDIAQEFKTWKNQSEMKCFYSSVTGGKSDFVKIFNSVYDKDRRITHDNTTYKTGDSSPTSEISRMMSSILDNDQVSMKAKLKQIKSYIYDPRYRRNETYVRLGSDYASQGAAHKWNPYNLVLQFYKNCQSGKTSQSRVNNFRVSDVISRVKKIAIELKKDKKNFSKDVKRSLRSTMINCKSDNTAMKGDFCSKENKPFSIDQNFCLKKANTCSKNVQKCLGKIEKDFNNTRNTVRKNVTKFNKVITDYVKKRRDQIIAMKEKYDNTMKTVESFGLARDASGDFSLSDIDRLLKGEVKEKGFGELEDDLGIDLFSMDSKDLIEAFRKQKVVLKQQLENTKTKFEELINKEIAKSKQILTDKQSALEQCESALNSVAGIVKEHSGSCRAVANAKGADTEKVEQIIEAYNSLPNRAEIPSDIEKKIKKFKEISKAIEEPRNAKKSLCSSDYECSGNIEDAQHKCSLLENMSEKVKEDPTKQRELRKACNKAEGRVVENFENRRIDLGKDITNSIAEYSEHVDICKQQDSQDSLGRGDGKRPSGSGDDVDAFLRSLTNTKGF